MIDVLFGAGLVALVIRGWMRGLLRQAIELGVLVGGVVLGFRLSGPAGAFIRAVAGTSPTTSRIVGGIAIFLLISIGAAVISRILHWGVRMLPGLPTMNRLGGAAAAGSAWVLIVAVALSIATVLPVSEGAATILEESAVARAVTAPDGPVQGALSMLGGDRAVARAIAMQNQLGTQRVAAGIPIVALPPTPSADTDPDHDSAHALFDDLNRERVERDLDPLAWSDALQAEALKRALGAYKSGRLAKAAPVDVEDQLGAAGFPVYEAWESMVMAPSAEAVHETMIGNENELDAMTDARYRRIGVGVVDGPYGLLTVYVFAG